MKLKWICEETVKMVGVGIVKKGDKFELADAQDAQAAVFIEKGYAEEVKGTDRPGKKGDGDTR